MSLSSAWASKPMAISAADQVSHPHNFSSALPRISLVIALGKSLPLGRPATPPQRPEAQIEGGDHDHVQGG